MLWQVNTFSQLDTNTLFDLLKARVDVFVVEQQCAYPELDEVDRQPDTFHVMAYEGQSLCAYARVYRKSQSECAIGRVLVLPNARGRGLANPLMLKATEVCNIHFGDHDVVLSAQTYLLKFYQSLGFVAEGEEYLEDGIPHQDMRLNTALK
ncbi:GNAT family N-acetyltransferase [Pseudoalteromonas byunsanensis]|uniref:GNAT family N-acetyltransferase n=1 Tax=Pseudoalteromonas byunsanensis TaxID=327939 RepID=A0A1S1N907_9GAMM|nr:GNAT family N-acetyltransferase [Pseudoalteromonas byunsanensis]OHU95843.1 GNAT family N-acetyltransferase [Pseudoalteromonas byunsanensis]